MADKFLMSGYRHKMYQQFYEIWSAFLAEITLPKILLIKDRNVFPGKNTLYTFKIKDAIVLKMNRDLSIAYTEPHILIQLKPFKNDDQGSIFFKTPKPLFSFI